MKIGVIGAGYVGLVTGACFASLGHSVSCLDSDAEKIRSLQAGHIPFYEPGLHEMVADCVAAKRLSFGTEIASIVNHCEILFICVHTPPQPDGGADLTYVEQVSKQIAQHLRKYCLVVDKSTVPVETGEWVYKTIRRYARKGVPFDVASNPEFLREGSAIRDFKMPDRIVVGVTSPRAEKLLRKLYGTMKAPLLVTDIKSAELIKHASNSFLAMKISFANALARVCDAVGADVEKVTQGMGLDPRIGNQFLRAGIGFGGSCFPKDVSAFQYISKHLGISFDLLKEVLRINETQAEYFVEKVRGKLKKMSGKTIAVLGLSFKSDTDDMRCAPSLAIISMLQKAGATIRAYDPQAMPKARGVLKKVHFARDPYDAACGADAVLLLTEWKEFFSLDWKKILRVAKGNLLFDGRNMLEPQEMRKCGFHYTSIGRP
jgi:UDPglucose 6-dehydrogenase